MGHVKEPDGVYLVVDPTPLKKTDRVLISKVIAHYKSTGKKVTTEKLVARKPEKVSSSRSMNKAKK